jgi:hypothetical protein
MWSVITDKGGALRLNICACNSCRIALHVGFDASIDNMQDWKRIRENTCEVDLRKCWLVYSCCSHLEHRASVKRFVSLQFLNLRQSVGLLARLISPSQGSYLTQTQNKHRHPCLEWYSNPRSQRSIDRRQIWLRPRGHCDRQMLGKPV